MTAVRSVSIIIPTHNRRASVERTLRALSAQSYPPTAVEIVVVADGCTDGTNEMPETGRPFVLRVLKQDRVGPATARNRGAAASTGELLIFLDDDVEPCEDFVAAHVVAHGDGNAARVAIGYLPPELQGRCDFFAIMLRAWWEAMFERMREEGHRYAYNDLLSGNFSIGRPLFTAVGGFDESLRCHEDYELGFRLIAAGARLQFVPDAWGWHHEHTVAARALSRKRDEGAADVALARKHPELAPALPLARASRHLARRARLLHRLARSAPALGDALEACCRSMLPLLEGARLRTRWRRLLDDLLSYWYWRGVHQSLAAAQLETLRAAPDTPDRAAYDVDLQPGLEAAMQALDAAPAVAIRLRWGPLLVGTVPFQPGAEPLRGRHLRGLLRTRFAQRFSETLRLADDLEGHGTANSWIAAPPGAEKWSA